MKRIVIILALTFAAVSAHSCVGFPDEGGRPVIFRAFADDPSTRTSLGAGNSIVWSLSDRISVFAGTGAKGTTLQASSVSADGRETTFSGVTTATAGDYCYALSPAQSDAFLVSSSGTVHATLPTVQTGTVGSFDPAAALSLSEVAQGADADAKILHFKNVGALLAIKIPGNYVTAIRITSRDGNVAMSGGADIRYNGGAPVVTPSSTSRNYVTLNGLSGKIGKVVYAVVYPGNYSQGFEVSYITGDTYNTYRSSTPLDLARNGNVYLLDKDWSVQNDRTGPHAGYVRLISPVISSCSQTAFGEATIHFSCTSGKKAGYKFYRRDANSMGEGELVATVNDASVTSYTFTGLKSGGSYDFGVSSIPSAGNTEGLTDSETAWYDDLTINAISSNVSVKLLSTAESYYNIVINYSIGGLSQTNAEHGLIFSESSASPTCNIVGAAGKLPGPTLTSTAETTIRQCVPNAVFEAGKQYYIRAYCYDPTAGNFVYSTVSRLALAEQPEAFAPISREALTSPAQGVEVYSFTAGGKSGYYAVADCSGSIRLRVLNAPLGTSSAKTLATQAAADGALVLINGQIFGLQGNMGIGYMGGALGYNNSSDAGIELCYSYGNDYSAWQPITRAILGVDASGKPGAYWCTLIGGTPYFFDRPIPAGTAGSLVYPQVTASSGPGPKRSWTPKEALSTGPMLLYGGKVCVSEDKIATGVYYTNYELWSTKSGDIYGSSRPRTAIGYDSATGRVFLAVLSSSATQTQMARIMLGLGCDYAMNLDGGGSSQMFLAAPGTPGTGRLLVPDRNRAVKSTVGFFLSNN